MTVFPTHLYNQHWCHSFSTHSVTSICVISFLPTYSLCFPTMSAIDVIGTKVGEVNNNGVHTFLNKLSNAAPDTKIKVRVARMWDTLNITKKKEIISTDMVLIDEKANCIHATIPRRFSPSLKKVLQEGKIYVISHFEVSKNKEKYAVVENNPSMLSFYGDAIVTEEGSDDNTIPRYIFEFVNFNDLIKRCGKEVLADVIGFIIDVDPIEEKTTVNGKVDMLSLHLGDGSGNVLKVTLWDDYAPMFNQKLIDQMHATPKPNVAIFTSTLVKQYQGELYVSSSRSTTIYINIDTPEVADLILSSKGKNSVLKTTETLSLTNVDVKTISELLSMAVSGVYQGDVVYNCVATVDDILLKNGLYYVSCPHCRKTVSSTETDFNCEHCTKKVDYPKIRYRLELQVNDSTESTIFVLFAEVAEQLAQLKLDDLTPDLENTGRDSDLPKQLQHIIGSKHIFQVKLSSYFERRGVQSFTAHKILKPVVKIEKEDNIATACSSSSGSLTIEIPDLPKKRRKLILHSNKSGDKDQNEDVEDLED
ncbi:replication protein A 70 kDa DNA-binding subunit C isoform X2 [Medicago truncatula]|uniref:replication protein A 70 kDa DNA-binding subunit C isoform X2 n=1 Tax=Medicago truncatula TaxID=3880 RepID=UPI0019671DD1|nr:replication protein A 70 kDa DNA-binding subunit C-like isoform X2 [Medicago truncatula]